jgi:acetyl esterase/lipase
MKMKFTLLTSALLLFFSFQLQAQRYLTEVFTNVKVTKGVKYATNISVISGAPAPEDLYVNIYEPEGDTEKDRPLILYAHTGSFLPIALNGGTTGDTSDYTVKAVCTRLAKMGYVAAVFTYRKGWNPLDTTVELRRRGLINAAYKGIQDYRTCIRFFRKSVEENGNPYGIDPCKIAGWGQGTGGYITTAGACLQQEEIYIDKFKDPITGKAFVDTLIWGNLDGTKPGAASLTNHIGYNSEVTFAFNAGGALGDVSWLDPGEPPVFAAHVIKDPFAPFGVNFMTGQINCEGPVIVPTTQEFVVNVAGSKCMVNAANTNGINASLLNPGFNDALSNHLKTQAFAEANLWAIWTASPQAGPWDYWDATYWGAIPHPSCQGVPPPQCSFHTINSITNPDMSLNKANHYIDTLIGFFAPRAHHLLITLDPQCTVNSNEVLEDARIGIYPNPADDFVWIETLDNRMMEGVELYDLSGRLVSRNNQVDAKSVQLHRNGLSTGMYIAKIRFKEGIATRKVMFR